MRHAPIFLAFGLASCGALSSDDPASNASYGYWESKSEILSLSIDGMTLEPYEIPQEARDELDRDLGCTLVSLATKDDIEQLIKNYNKSNSCTIKSLDREATGIKITGTCDGPSRGNLDQVSNFSAFVQQTPNKLTVKTSQSSVVTDRQSDESAEIAAEVETQHYRVRSC